MKAINKDTSDSYDVTHIKNSITPIKMSFLEKLFMPRYFLKDASVFYVEKLNIYRIKVKLEKHGVFKSTVNHYYENCFPGGDPYPWYSKDEVTALSKCSEILNKVNEEFFV